MVLGTSTYYFKKNIYIEKNTGGAFAHPPKVIPMVSQPRKHESSAILLSEP